MLHRRYTRLPTSQQQLVSILLGAFLLLLANSLLLLIFDRSTAGIYMSMVLFHVVLGIVVLAPVIYFLFVHIRMMPLSKNRNATIAGIFTAISLAILFVTGILLFAVGATYGGGAVLALHIITTVSGVLGFIAHVSLKQGVRFHFLSWSVLWKSSLGEAVKHPLSIILIAGIVVSAFFFVSFWLDSRTPRFVETGEDNVLFPGQAVLAHQGFLEDVDLGRSESCGQAGCHPDILEQWKASAHRFSSFNNQYYRASIERLEEQKGTAVTRWCASCHDPLVLFTGRMQETIDMEHPTAHAGLTCMACHAVEGLRDVKGNGRMVMAKPDEYPFARSEDPLRKWLHNKLVRSKPEPHRRAMLKPVHRTAEFCGTCHKVSIPPEVNDYRWKRGQNQYDSWHASGVSGNTVRSFYLPAQAKTCFDCHMPLVPSDDEGNDNGFVRSHRFAAANTTIPFLNDYPDQMEAVQNMLQSAVVTMDLFQVTVNNRNYGPEEKMPLIKSGDDVQLSLVIRNRGVGHIFPAGTNDSNEIWVEMLAKNKAGKTVLASGLLENDGTVDSTAHFLGAKLVDRNSKLIAKRDVQNWVATIYANTISPGTARNVYYRFKVPAGVDIAEFQATLFYRKFRQGFHQWVFRSAAEIPEQPITAVAKALRTVSETPDDTYPLWQRWNDFGIGLLLEGDTRRALTAFEKVTDIVENPEGPINQARVLIAEGQVDRAAKILEIAEQRQPGYLKTAFFRGDVHKAYGDYEKTLREWERVAADYPNDRVLLLGIGRLYYLLEEYETALNWCERVLEIDPESLGGLYNKMLCLGAMGKTEAFERAKKLYEYHKIDDSARAVTAKYKKKHPMANREAQMIHDHGLHPVNLAQPEAKGNAASTSSDIRKSNQQNQEAGE